MVYWKYVFLLYCMTIVVCCIVHLPLITLVLKLYCIYLMDKGYNDNRIGDEDTEACFRYININGGDYRSLLKVALHPTLKDNTKNTIICFELFLRLTNLIQMFVTLRLFDVPDAP